MKETIIDYAASNGFDIQGMPFDGKLRRYARDLSRPKKKDSWFILWEQSFQNNRYIYGIVAGDWRTDERFEKKA